MILISHRFHSDGLNGPTYRVTLVPALSQSSQFPVSLPSSSVSFFLHTYPLGSVSIYLFIMFMADITSFFINSFLSFPVIYPIFFFVVLNFIVGVILVVNFRCGFTIYGVTIVIGCHVYRCAISYVTSFTVLFFLRLTISTFIYD